MVEMEEDDDYVDSPELQSFLEEEKQKAVVHELVSKLTDVCWEKCVTSTPSGNFSSSETKCLSNCAQRFMEISELILHKLEH